MQTTVFRQLSEPVTAFQYTVEMHHVALAEAIVKISEGQATLLVELPEQNLYVSTSPIHRRPIKTGDWVWANDFGTHVAEDKAFREQYVEQAYIDRRHQLPNAHAAPRVLQQGDPEPDHSTRWQEEDGTVWRFESVSESATGAAGWTTDSPRSLPAHYRWDSRRMSFPLTEVTDRG